MRNPLIPPSLLLTKLLSKGAVVMISMERKLLQAITTPFPAIYLKIQFLANFGHFSLFVPMRAKPLDPISTFIDQNVITGCCCNDIYGKRATPGYYHPIFLLFAWKLNFWIFSAIFSLWAFFWATPWPHIHFNWQKCYHWVMLQWYLTKESLSKLSKIHFPPLPHATNRPEIEKCFFPLLCTPMGLLKAFFKFFSGTM